jgi:hypothetical protein
LGSVQSRMSNLETRLREAPESAFGSSAASSTPTTATPSIPSPAQSPTPALLDPR